MKEEVKEEKDVKEKTKSKKPLIIIISVVGAIILIIAGIFIYKKIEEEKKNSDTYNHGLSLIEKKEWERATTLFTGLGDYKDSKEKIKEIIFLENTEKIEKGIKYPVLYDSDLKSGISNLMSNRDYGKTKEKLDSYLNQIKEVIDKEKKVPNSAQKDYSSDVISYLNVLSTYRYDKEYESDVKPYLCEFATQAFKEGFVIYPITSTISSNCDDSSFMKNNKYYKLVDNAWMAEKSSGRYASYNYFFQFLTNGIMNYEETYISIYGMVPLKNSYWYKIFNNAIYTKSSKSESYKKKFTIEKLTDTTVKFSGKNYTFKKM